LCHISITNITGNNLVAYEKFMLGEGFTKRHYKKRDVKMFPAFTFDFIRGQK